MKDKGFSNILSCHPFLSKNFELFFTIEMKFALGSKDKREERELEIRSDVTLSCFSATYSSGYRLCIYVMGSNINNKRP